MQASRSTEIEPGQLQLFSNSAKGWRLRVTACRCPHKTIMCHETCPNPKTPKSHRYIRTHMANFSSISYYNISTEFQTVCLPLFHISIPLTNFTELYLRTLLPLCAHKHKVANVAPTLTSISFIVSTYSSSWRLWPCLSTTDATVQL